MIKIDELKAQVYKASKTMQRYQNSRKPQHKRAFQNAEKKLSLYSQELVALCNEQGLEIPPEIKLWADGIAYDNQEDKEKYAKLIQKVEAVRASGQKCGLWRPMASIEKITKGKIDYDIQIKFLEITHIETGDGSIKTIKPGTVQTFTFGGLAKAHRILFTDDFGHPINDKVKQVVVEKEVQTGSKNKLRKAIKKLDGLKRSLYKKYPENVVNDILEQATKTLNKEL